tara:strand:+ start:1084 stop:1308 length:225 start_codon:yes stop_codon:yes gene_type:complete
MKILKELSAEAVGVILSIIVMIASVGATFGITQHQISKHEQRLQDMDKEYQRDHDLLLQIKRDVHWIRGSLESK